MKEDVIKCKEGLIQKLKVIVEEKETQIQAIYDDSKLMRKPNSKCDIKPFIT